MKMLENRPKDALGSLAETVETEETEETVETVETARTDNFLTYEIFIMLNL